MAKSLIQIIITRILNLIIIYTKLLVNNNFLYIIWNNRFQISQGAEDEEDDDMKEII